MIRFDREQSACNRREHETKKKLAKPKMIES